MQRSSTKKTILAAARKIFVEQGFAGASMGKIAKSAGVNHSLIFHHFGNKEQLWLAVKQDIVKDAQRHGNTLPDTHLPFAEFLQELFRQNINFYRNYPDIIRLLNWQRLERSSDSVPGVTLSAETQAWMAAFKHYQQQGDIHKRHKPEFILTFILSIISSAALDPNIFICKSEDFDAYIDFCVRCVCHALSSAD